LTRKLTQSEKYLVLLLEKITCIRERILHGSEIDEYLTIIEQEIDIWTNREFRLYMRSRGSNDKETNN
jgi:hypothetical protein